jgi:Ca2+-binding RTX toxin-like protein
MTITVVANGPAYATDLRPMPGTAIGIDYGTDDDIYFAWNLTDMTVTIHGGNDTVTTGFGNDTIFDDPAAPLLAIGSRSSGDDVIHAGSGNDTIFAGDGNNTYDGGDDTDTVNYSRATVGITVNLGSGTGQANGTDTLVSIENVVGSDQGDWITGSSIDNVLKGGKGDDHLFGGDGRDALYGGDDNDILVGGKGADTMYGEGGIDTLDYTASSAGVTVDLSRGTGRGGDAEGDSFKYVENITGSRFNDTLIGDNGANVLIGGAGQDTLIGGGGKDTFTFHNVGFGSSDSTPANPDLIKDFVQGEDIIDLSHLHTGYYGGPPHQLVDHFSGAANEVMVVVSAGSTTVLSDFDGDKVADFAVELSNPVHLTANDFLL